jgi:hypothetical protein
MGTMSYFSGHSFQSMRQTTHLQLIQSLRKRELYLYSPQNAFMENMGGNAISFLGMFTRLLKRSFTVIQIVSPQEYYMHTNYY